MGLGSGLKFLAIGFFGSGLRASTFVFTGACFTAAARAGCGFGLAEPLTGSRLAFPDLAAGLNFARVFLITSRPVSRRLPEKRESLRSNAAIHSNLRSPRRLDNAVTPNRDAP